MQYTLLLIAAKADEGFPRANEELCKASFESHSLANTPTSAIHSHEIDNAMAPNS
jgi:hypothetical protein